MRVIGGLACAGLLVPTLSAVCQGGDAVRLAYFHGGKSYLIYRAYVDGYFEREGVGLVLHSKYMGKPGFRPLPRTFTGLRRLTHNNDGSRTYFGKVSGTEIAQALARREFDGGTMGESSFLMAISRGAPLVAVAMLGHDSREAPAKAIVLRKDVRIDQPGDFKGKTLISRRGGPGEAVMLREFLLSIGLAPGRDVHVIDQQEEDEVEPLLLGSKVDGGLYHVSTIRRLLKSGDVRIYRTMDWMNPELSHGLLVFRKDFARDRPRDVERILRAYVKRIRYEAALPEESRLREPIPERHGELGVEGMDLPRTDDPPWVRRDLLEELQRLFLKHGMTSARVSVGDHVDATFLRKVLDAEAR